MTPKKILFFTPNGGRGGSEMMLWYLIKDLDKQNIDWKVITFAKGDLLNEKNYPGKVHLLPSRKSRRNEISSKINRNLLKRDIDDNFILKIHKKFDPDLWYFNTIVTINKSHLAIKNNIKYAFHLHESLTVFDLVKSDVLKDTVANSYLNIGCSKKLSDNLNIVGSKNTKTFYSGVNFNEIQIHQDRNSIRNRLNIKDSDFVWYMSGGQSVNKGIDYFIKISEEFKGNPNVKFVWVGRKRDRGYNLWAEKYIQSKKLANVSMLNQLTKEYFDYVNAFDGFLLTSREDSFPLVMVEAAYLGKPIIGFDSGGISEFLIDNMGDIQEDFSIKGIVKKMENLINDKTSFNSKTSVKRAKEFDLNSTSKNWIDLL